MREYLRLPLVAATLLAAVGTTAGIATASTAHPAAAPRPAAVSPAGAPACGGPDCLVYDLSTQASCTEATSGPTFDARWKTGLSSETDEQVFGGKIAAFKIQWSTGWSGWYVPGVNDLDIKFNPGPNTERRVWGYFYDHTFDYVICR